ncbi:MAG TPA: RNA methyltransferase [Anaerolineales bacterium]|nr:RNA methyltransferase [Anaerolineales bacterium]HMR98115.1 RNA methyltransferase [Anaerolineales bacterium]HNQ94386.1 RNA methyltransferase [Anaerolineales bacterium]HNS62038.1 RNA methyltransferase [Anaerolineales bacterium]
MDITSAQNPRVKHIVKLRDDKKTRKEDGLMLVEGFDEIQHALAAGHTPQTLLFGPELASRALTDSSIETLTVSRAVFEKISYRENPDGWMGIFPIPKISLADLTLSKTPLMIVAESIEKPGNLGAILRTADAAGVDALLVCDARVDVWNPNVVRASRGAVFSVPVVECENAEALKWLKRGGMRVVAASPSAEEIYSDVDLKSPVAIVVGTEDEGLSDFWMTNADVKVKIPMMGKVNSLNVSVSTALIVYEAMRQRA